MRQCTLVKSQSSILLIAIPCKISSKLLLELQTVEILQTRLGLTFYFLNFEATSKSQSKFSQRNHPNKPEEFLKVYVSF